MHEEGAAQFESEAERIVRELREQIIEGRRPQGSKLVEREIGQEMGVSRVPVREALKELISEGLAHARPHSWAVVREFTAADVEDLIEVRSALETLSFRLAAERATARGIADLEADLERERAAARNGDHVEARRAAAAFHTTVNGLAANGLMTELYRVTDSRMRWLLAQHDDLDAMLSEHEALFEAVAAADGARAARLAGRHVRSSRRTAVRHMTSQGALVG